MDTNLHQLSYILNLEKFQKIQDDIAKATDMAIIAIDYKGNPITQHSRCSEFCEEVRKDKGLSRFCEKCDSRGGLEAARNQEAYIYVCHIGVVDFAIPIIVDGQYLGALMAGQVRLEDEQNQNKLERIVSKKYQIDLEEYPDLKALHNKLHIMSLDKIESVAQMMYHIINYIVEEAVLKTKLNETNQKLTSLNEMSTKTIEKLQDPIEKLNQAIDQSSAKSILLKPALDYIDEHFHEKIYLDDMAYRCNISPSYFSRIFKRELGLTYSSYINKMKVSKAKELLEETNLPIINISLDLGYDDCGYFIKIFKKNYGITPANYRKTFNNERV
ncbi:MAG: PocR ligand-binding domain-containing protein [Clostridiales bacterium]|nr:PocR ligand-binding domain-containing protein [Clostridiales bacterium]